MTALALIRELFVFSAELRPSKKEYTLDVRIHLMASPVHDRRLRPWDFSRNLFPAFYAVASLPFPNSCLSATGKPPILSELNSTCTLFSLGVYKDLIRPDAPETRVVASGKLFGWVLAILAMLLAPQLANFESIFGYLQKMNGIYFIPIFAAVLMGMLNRRLPPLAGNFALVAGIVMIALGYFIPPRSMGGPD